MCNVGQLVYLNGQVELNVQDKLRSVTIIPTNKLRDDNFIKIKSLDFQEFSWNSV